MAYFRGEELLYGRSFPFQKLVSKRPRAYTRWGLLSDFTPGCQKIYFATESSTVESRDNYIQSKNKDRGWQTTNTVTIKILGWMFHIFVTAHNPITALQVQ